MNQILIKNARIINEGKIIKSGDYNLVKTLEEKGYQEFV